MPTSTCYMCAAQAVSDEHAPPRCIFPAAKDLPAGIDLRRNLITVPACGDHNMATAKDDEYLMVLLVTHFEDNQVGYNQFATKAVRALKRSPAFVETTFKNASHVLLDGQPTIAFQVDDARFERELDKIVRAVHFHATRRKLLGRITLFPTAFRKMDAELDREIQSVGSLARTFLAEAPRHGENPDAFFYQLSAANAGHGGLMRLVFYGGFEVYSTWPATAVAT